MSFIANIDRKHCTTTFAATKVQVSHFEQFKKN